MVYTDIVNEVDNGIYEDLGEDCEEEEEEDEDDDGFEVDSQQPTATESECSKSDEPTPPVKTHCTCHCSERHPGRPGAPIDQATIKSREDKHKELQTHLNALLIHLYNGKESKEYLPNYRYLAQNVSDASNVVARKFLRPAVRIEADIGPLRTQDQRHNRPGAVKARDRREAAQHNR